MTTVVIADDSALLREGMVGLLQRQGFEVIAQESRADSLRRTIQDLADQNALPDVLISDVRMPPNMTNDGLLVAVDLKSAYPQLGVLVVSQYVAPIHAQQLFSLPAAAGSGGAGYLLKDRIAEIADFVHTISLVTSGGVVIDPEVARAMMRSNRSGLGELTAREFEVLELMARGLSNSQIASELVLSSAAVAKHVASIFAKLNLPPDQDNRRVRAILAFLSEDHTLG